MFSFSYILKRFFFFFQAEDGIRDKLVTGVQTCALPISTKSAIEALEQDPQMGPHLFSPGIRQCIDLNYATSQRQTIWEYAPRSRAAEDYTRFLDFVDRQEEADAHAIKEEAKTAI